MTGPEQRFRQLFDVNYRSVMAYALRRTSNRADAEDVVSATFTVAWRRLDVVPQDDSEQRRWLYGVARRVLANHRRGLDRANRLALRLGSDATYAAPADGELEDAADAADALSAMAQLNSSDQELLMLALWEELSHADIAKVMGTSVPNVAVRLHRAKRKLRTRFRRGPQDGANAGHVLLRRVIGTPDPESTR